MPDTAARLACVAALATAFCPAAQGSEPIEAAARRQWSQRRAELESVHFTIRADHARQGDARPATPDDPFATSHTTDSSTIDYYYHAGRFSIDQLFHARDGQRVEDHGRGVRRLQVAFDQQSTRALWTPYSDQPPTGREHRGGQPPGWANVAGVMAVRLWLAPMAVLRQQGWDVRRMRASPAAEPLPESRLVAFDFPRRHGDRDTVGRLSVDPARGCLPVRWVVLHRGQTRSSLDIAYALTNERWAPSDWTRHRFDRSADTPTETVTGRVEQARLNLEIDSEQFALRFPASTRVTSTADASPTRSAE
ncbi:hypothetical protein KOR34_18570 [Posidoniimonas corsicana]|uniref:Uncharacterized protein n=1 Tax=Posidoniimonas corsicana TaxID=1938618 RepID=A0A5C5VGY1_9BACT|nr:hypothetical protein [Posidoniimonas corsicana]TWT36912.1 hypothetical protein KOR34_18570 [Posidoniimonas corsicana]